MEKFIALSSSSKKILKIAQMAISLPVHCIISGQVGVGRKILASIILPDAQSFEAKELEQLIINNKINLEEYNSIIIYNIEKIINKKEFINNIANIRIVTTCLEIPTLVEDHFAIKINIPPLEERAEDLEELKKIYINEAKRIYSSTITPKDIKIDLSGNGITLKQSIYKSILLRSMTKQEIIDTLNIFFTKELKNKKSYKDLLSLFEIPLLQAATKVYKSQLQMASNLNINRITLRKKLNKYFGI